MITNTDLKSQLKFDKGLNTVYNLFSLEGGHSPNCMNVKYNFDGSLEKRLGSTTQNTTAMQTAGGNGIFDYGATDNTSTQIRWLVVASGTGAYCSTNLGVNLTVIDTSITAGLVFYERSKYWLIRTTEKYDAPVYWDGSGGTYVTALAPSSAPSVKYVLDFQGFALFMNSNDYKRRIWYVDNALMLTDPFEDYFELPSSRDDEITGGIVYKGKAYISTKYKLFRLDYIGGNPDFGYKEVKDWGYVPRTMKIISMGGQMGEVIIGLTWSKQIKIFDGNDELTISDNVEKNNGICEFALDDIDDIAIQYACAEVDRNEQLYKLVVPITSGVVTSDLPTKNFNTHTLCFNYRNVAFFPYDNTTFRSMVMAESNNVPHFLAADVNGRVYKTDTTNKDLSAGVNDYYDSPFAFKRTPQDITRHYTMALNFSETSSGTIYYHDRTDFSKSWGKYRDKITLSKTDSKNQVQHSINIPKTANVYQYRITSSANTADPWRLNRVDSYFIAQGIGKT